MSSNDPTVEEVRDMSSTGFKQLGDSKIQDCIDDAVSELGTIYDGRMSRFPTFDGDRNVFLKNLAAHKATKREGGEAQSESGEGGSVNYRGGNVEEYLDLTRYGQTAERHISYDHSIAAIRTY